MSPPLLHRRLAATVAVAAALGCAAAQARECRLATLDGPAAELWVEGRWRAVAAADLPLPLHPVAAILRTGPQARAQVLCDDGVAVTLGTSTELNLATLTEAARGRGVLMRLLHGVVGVVAKGAWPSFEVRSPLVIAAVRSTEWAVSHDPAEGSAVFVRAGEVAVRAPDAPGAVRLAPGEGTDRAPGGPLGPATTWGAARVEALRARLGLGWR